MKDRGSKPDSPGKSSSRNIKLKLTMQYATHAADVPVRSEFRKWIKVALVQDAEIVMRIVDEVEGRSLNRDFRGKDYATNVLTFGYSNTRPLSGDIVLCTPVIENEARQQHKNLDAHYAHLTVHGILHLQGYDHESDAGAAIMERLEAEIMESLGYHNPYDEIVD
ncbi:rRNA maturation RNase YbeY [Nitrosovibrio tenuis]